MPCHSLLTICFCLLLPLVTLWTASNNLFLFEYVFRTNLPRYGAALHYFTDSKSYNIAIRRLARVWV